MASFQPSSTAEFGGRAPDNFHFERPSAPVNWTRFSSVQVESVRDRGEAGTLQHFLGDIAMGDIEDEEASRRGAKDPRALHAYRVLQLQLQYLLYSHQALREKAAESEKVSSPLNPQILNQAASYFIFASHARSQRLQRLQQLEAKTKKKALIRKETLQRFTSEARQQEEVMTTYHTLLEHVDPGLANRVGWTDDGRLVERRSVDINETQEPPVRLLQWNQHNDKSGQFNARR
eukprot:CAMPEP_0171894438 /NCGR_PEP_ID=MMETSP0992-20121227/46464_1 /TAXON_ID=483369 /ORGANISM="non described non described, Strain CCMP2098" /LENGTH=232 /DNA_ID=CAMNT_0012522223 /DNA_START=321 /DNA_END=1020 /DNA_ORIENTATION=+